MKSENDGPTITMKEYVDTILELDRRRYEDRFKAQENALELALAAQQVAHGKTTWMVGLLVSIVIAIFHFVR